MPAASHLRPAALFHHNPADDLPAYRHRPIDGTGITLTATEYHNLWFYLGTQDPRATRAYLAADTFDPSRGSCALVDPADGAIWIHHDGGITLAGADHLRDQLITLINDWERMGRPSATEWITRLKHFDTGAAGLHRPYQWNLTPNA